VRPVAGMGVIAFGHVLGAGQMFVIVVVVFGELSFFGRLFGIGRRNYVVGSGPGELFGRRVATAAAPTLFGAGTSAGVMLAGKRPTRRLRDARRERVAGQRCQICQEGNRHHGAATLAGTRAP
jgi:hypothetical protein